MVKMWLPFQQFRCYLKLIPNPKATYTYIEWEKITMCPRRCLHWDNTYIRAYIRNKTTSHNHRPGFALWIHMNDLSPLTMQFASLLLSLLPPAAASDVLTLLDQWCCCSLNSSSWTSQTSLDQRVYSKDHLIFKLKHFRIQVKTLPRYKLVIVHVNSMPEEA